MKPSLVRGLRGLRDDVRTVARGWRWARRPLVPRSAEPFAPARDRREFPTGWARSRAAVEARSAIHKVGLSPLLRAEVQPVVQGLDVLDGLEPPLLFVANHASHLDTALLLCTLPDEWRRRTTVAAAADYFFDVWWRSVGSALVFNTFPIDRRGGALSRTPGQLLGDGWNVVIFPEGGRSPDGWTQRFRPGAAWLSVHHRVPVVPVGIRGSYAAMPRGRGWPVPGRPPVRVRYGPAMQPPPSDVRAFARQIEQAVGRLLDEDETTWWESLRRQAGAGDAPPAPYRPAARWRRVWAASEPLERPGSAGVWRRSG